MSAELETYTQRLARIAAILQPVLSVGDFLPGPNNTDEDRVNALRCAWIDPDTGLPAVDVFIDAPSDLVDTLAGLRDQVTGDDPYEPESATEVGSSSTGEYVFIRHLAHSVTAIVDQCRVQVYPPEGFEDLATLVEPALEIGRGVGCTPYRDDYTAPPLPADLPQPRWGEGPGLPGIPPVQPGS